MNTIFDTLREEHNVHRTLMASLCETSGGSDERQLLFGRLQNALLSHAVAEERVFYSALLGESLTQPKSSHSIKEHQELESRLEELAAMDLSNPNWLRSFNLLRKEVEHHEEEEEREVFQLAGKVLSDADKIAMPGKFLAVRTELELA